MFEQRTITHYLSLKGDDLMKTLLLLLLLFTPAVALAQEQTLKIKLFSKQQTR